MKRFTLYIVVALLGALYGFAAVAEPVNCNGATGNVPIPGTLLSVPCPPAGTNPPPVNPPPVTPPPPTRCNASQVSSVIGTKTLQRQCYVSMNVMPTGGSYGGDAISLGAVLGGTSWPGYNYSGYSPTFAIQSGYYIALAFTPTSAGGVNLSANGSFGDGGTISVSTQPGVLTRGSAGFVCGLNRGGTNGIYISTSGGVCPVIVGTTYYLNLADVDANGNALCYNGRANSCAESLVSYTIYTSGQ